MRRGHRIAVIALACLGLIGGTVGWMATLAAGEPGTAKPAEPKATDPKASDSKAAAAPAPSPPPVVKLLDPGRDPKRPIRLKAARGTEEDLVMTMKTESSVITGGTPVNNPSTPPIRMTMRTRVTDVASSGDMTYEFVYTKCEVLDADQVEAPQTPMLKGMLTSLEGMKGTAVVSELGIARDMKLEKKEGMNPMLSQLLGGMTNAIQSISCSLPEAPLGIGARWTVTAQPEMNGIRIKQTTTYEVTAIEGSVWTLATRLEQGADEQDVSMPGMPPGLKMHLKSLKSTGAGTIVVDPSRLVPQKGKVQVSSEAEMRIDMGPQPQTMQTSQKLTIEIEGKAAEAEAAPTK